MTQQGTSKLSETDKSGVRAADRDSLLVCANIHLPAQNAHLNARIRNLSAGGLMAEAPVRVANGDVAEVELRNVGIVSGKVAWTAEGRFGIAFDFPIDPRVARLPVGQAKLDLPRHLENLNKPPKPKIRRV